MSYMRGDLLKKTRKLVKGLAIPSPTWLKAMEMASPVEPSLKVGKKKKTVEHPEDFCVRKFVKKHPNSVYHEVRMNKSGPPSSRIFAWRVLELKDEGVSEEDAMALADMEYREEKTAKRVAYKDLKKISRILGKEAPPNPYPSSVRETQTEERKYVNERFYNREILEIVHQMKEEKTAALQAKGFNQPQFNQIPGGRGQGGGWQQQGPQFQRLFGEGQLGAHIQNFFGSVLKDWFSAFGKFYMKTTLSIV